MLSPPVAGRAPAPYLALGPHDAERLDVRDGQTLAVIVATPTSCA